MSLQELKEQARQLPASDRLELVCAIVESLQDVPTQPPERSRIIKQMKGLVRCLRRAIRCRRSLCYGC